MRRKSPYGDSRLKITICRQRKNELGEGMMLYFTGNDRRLPVGQIQRNHKFQ